ncbi:MAG TPA: hypothetical protein VG738_07025 [Chitinophagaceae bacterium]|nr:hypothetical protein [Chitinophagaceae bacterium]
MERDRRYIITTLYCIIFYALMLYKYFNGMLLFQLQPSFFYNREDIFTWVFMQTGLHKWLLNNKTGCILFDVLFYTTPAIYLLHFRASRRTAYVSAMWMLIVNWAYVQCYTLYPSNSIEGHIAWLLFPLVFIARKDKTFWLLLDGLRYFFLFFFASAGLWKLRQGGAFDHLQMSGVLLYQHSQLLTNSPGYWQSKFIMWLVQHAWVSYILYLLATLVELSFITGFFTKKFDRVLVALFILFLIFDNLVMRIPYYEVLPLLLPLLPGTGKTNSDATLAPEPTI